MCHACHRLWKCYKTLPFCSLLTRCTTPCACHAKRHLNVQRCSEHVIFLKINILTSKCASRHNGVHFFGISTFKSGPRLRCFVHFDYDTCFVPQRRAFFSTSQLQKALRSSGVLYILTLGYSDIARPPTRTTRYIVSVARCDDEWHLLVCLQACRGASCRQACSTCAPRRSTVRPWPQDAR